MGEATLVSSESDEQNGANTKTRSKRLSKQQNVKTRQRVPKCYGGRPMNLSVNQTLNPDEFDHATLDGGHQGDQQVQDRLHGIHGNDVAPQDGEDPKENIDSSSCEQRVRRSFRIRRQQSSGDDLSCSLKFKRMSRTRLHYPETNTDVDRKKDSTESGNDSDRVLISPSNMDNKGAHSTVSHRLLRESNTNTNTVSGKVLACDTPEAEYGLRVSLRRRKDLLPLPARNKLLCP